MSADSAAESTRHPRPQAVATAIAACFGKRLITSQAVREQHGHTSTWVANQRPDAMALPRGVAEVQDADGDPATDEADAGLTGLLRPGPSHRRHG